MGTFLLIVLIGLAIPVGWTLWVLISPPRENRL